MVNTFFIFTNARDTFSFLDYKRLGKQRIEAKQIITILEKFDELGEMPNEGWHKHPAALMWVGYTNSLKAYFNLCVKEWINRGYNNTLELYNVDENDYRVVECEFDGTSAYFEEEFDEFCYPPWASFPPFILAHRAALIRKNPDFYNFLVNNEVKPYIELGYLWPSKIEEDFYSEWSMHYLAPIGEGAPSQFRISEEEVIKWKQNKNKNPKTGHAIKSTGKIYKDLEQAERFYGL